MHSTAMGPPPARMEPQTFGAYAPGTCYHHNLTGTEDGPRATWAEEDHHGGLRIGFCVSVLRARVAVYLVRIV
jgi:hypothetical protein